MLGRSFGFFNKEQQTEPHQKSIGEFLGELYFLRLPPWHENALSIIEKFMSDDSVYSDCISDNFYASKKIINDNPSEEFFVEQSQIDKLIKFRRVLEQIKTPLEEFKSDPRFSKMMEYINSNTNFRATLNLFLKDKEPDPTVIGVIKGLICKNNAELDKLSDLLPYFEKKEAEDEIRKLDQEFMDKLPVKINAIDYHANQAGGILTTKDIKHFELFYHYQKREFNRTVRGAITAQAVEAIKHASPYIDNRKLEIMKKLFEFYSQVNSLIGYREILLSPFENQITDSMMKKWSGQIKKAEEYYFSGRANEIDLPKEVGSFVDDDAKKEQLRNYLEFGLPKIKELQNDIFELINSYDHNNDTVRVALEKLSTLKYNLECEEKYLQQYFPEMQNNNSYLSYIPGADVVASTANVVSDSVIATANLLTNSATSTANAVTHGVTSTATLFTHSVTGGVTATTDTLASGMKWMFGRGTAQK